MAPLTPHRRASRTGSWRCAVRTPRRSRAPSSPSSSASRRARVLGAALEPIDRTQCSRPSESTAPQKGSPSLRESDDRGVGRSPRGGNWTCASLAPPRDSHPSVPHLHLLGPYQIRGDETPSHRTADVGPTPSLAVALTDMAGIREDRTNPRRIDILMKNKRMFQLAVPSAEERGPWCEALKKAFMDALSAEAAGISLDPPAAAEATTPPPASEEVEESMREDGEVRARGIARGRGLSCHARCHPRASRLVPSRLPHCSHLTPRANAHLRSRTLPSSREQTSRRCSRRARAASGKGAAPAASRSRSEHPDRVQIVNGPSRGFNAAALVTRCRCEACCSLSHERTGGRS